MKIVRRKDRVIGWECGETGRPGGRPLRVHGKGGRARATARVAPTDSLGAGVGGPMWRANRALPAALGSLPEGAERPRNDKFFGKKCGVRRHTWVPPYSFLVGQGPRALPGSGTDSGGGVRAPHF